MLLSSAHDVSARWLATKAYTITIGEDKEMFTLLEGALKQTSFLDKTAFATGPGSQHAPIDLESGPQVNRELSEADTAIRVRIPIRVGETADWHIAKDEKDTHPPRAFLIFSLALYGREPATPTGPKEEDTLMEAYVLADIYDYEPLRIAVVDHLDKYHSRTSLAFVKVKRMIRKLGDNPEDSMLAYLIRQVAWQYCVKLGKTSYEAENKSFERFQDQNLGDPRVPKAPKMVKALWNEISSYADRSSEVPGKSTKRRLGTAGPKGAKRRKNGEQADAQDVDEVAAEDDD